MNSLIKVLRLLCVAILGVTLLACSKSGDGQEDEHFASTQQRALEKAKAVDGMLQDVEAKKRRQMEQMER